MKAFQPLRILGVYLNRALSKLTISIIVFKQMSSNKSQSISLLSPLSKKKLREDGKRYYELQILVSCQYYTHGAEVRWLWTLRLSLKSILEEWWEKKRKAILQGQSTCDLLIHRYSWIFRRILWLSVPKIASR